MSVNISTLYETIIICRYTLYKLYNSIFFVFRCLFKACFIKKQKNIVRGHKLKKKKIPNELSHLLCDGTKDLVNEPKSKTCLSVKRQKNLNICGIKVA